MHAPAQSHPGHWRRTASLYAWMASDGSSLAGTSQPRPKNLFDDLRENYILILGAGFSDWLLWFLRMRVEKQLSESRDSFEYLADSRIAENPDLVFLRQDRSRPNRRAARFLSATQAKI